MTECKQLPGKHECGNKMNIRLTDFGDDNPDTPPDGWFIYGICDPCRKVIMINLTIGPEKPIEDRDFSIDYESMVEESKSNLQFNQLRKKK